MKNASLKPPLRILHLEDNARDAELIRDRLEAEGLDCEITLVNGRQAFESALEQTAFDLILCDYKLPDYDGGAALVRAQAKQPGVPVIIVSASGGAGRPVAAASLTWPTPLAQNVQRRTPIMAPLRLQALPPAPGRSRSPGRAGSRGRRAC